MSRGAHGEHARGVRLTGESVDIVMWAIVQRTPITPERVRARWDVHRATSYRWAQQLELARQRALNLDLPRAPDYRRPRLFPGPSVHA